MWRCTVLGFVCITPVASRETLSYEVSPPPIHLHACYKVSVRLTALAVMHTIECRFFGVHCNSDLLVLMQHCAGMSTHIYSVVGSPDDAPRLSRVEAVAAGRGFTASARNKGGVIRCVKLPVGASCQRSSHVYSKSGLHI